MDRRIGAGEAPVQAGLLGSCCCIVMTAAVLDLTVRSDTLSTARVDLAMQGQQLTPAEVVNQAKAY